MTKLFISYRSLDSKTVDECLAQIEALKDEHGNPRYTVWIDRRSIPTGQDWWQSIVKGIRKECEVFVFMVSQESVRSENCRIELRFARQLNRPIMPIVLPEEYNYNPIKDKRDLKIADQDIPEELKHGRFQFLFYKGSGFAGEFDRDLQELLKQEWREFPVPDDPADPTLNATGITTIADYYAEGVDAAWKTNFTLAVKHFQRVANSSDLILKDDAHYWINILRLYQQMAHFHEKPGTRYTVPKLWQAYIKMFGELPADFRVGVFGDEPFDPKKLNPNQGLPPPPPPPSPPIQVVTPPPSKVVIPPRPTTLLPAPFGWVEIAGGKGKMKTNESAVVLDVPTQRYWIAKYPVTNGQFAKFIEADGYKQRQWWTEAGWKQREKEQWAQPRFWTDGEWNGATQPVVGVSWYEAIAFCQWLSEASGKKITLPSDAQWQYAAQGTDGRAYPWGNKWDGVRCNNSVSPYDSNVTTPVTAYEGKGDSPFGVVDMAGNVWEWCLTEYDSRRDDINGKNKRVLRGGSWFTDSTVWFRCDSRDGAIPIDWFNVWGFRLALS